MMLSGGGGPNHPLSAVHRSRTLSSPVPGPYPRQPFPGPYPQVLTTESAESLVSNALTLNRQRIHSRRLLHWLASQLVLLQIRQVLRPSGERDPFLRVRRRMTYVTV